MDVVKIAMERRMALSYQLIELEEFIRAGEAILAAAERRSVSGGRRRPDARFEDVAAAG